MGLEAIAIIIIAVIVIGYFWGTQLINEFNTIASTAYNQYATTTTDNNLKIPIKAGEQLCSLKVVFNPFLGANVVPPIYVRIDNGASSTTWSNCYNVVPNAADLLPRAYLPAMDVFGLYNPSSSGYKFSATLVADDGTQTHPIVNPVPAVGLNNNISGVGQTFSLTFVFNNIPRQHYVLQFSSDSIGINQAGSGNTYSQQINP